MTKLQSLKHAAIGAALALPIIAHAQTGGDPFTAAMADATSKVGTYAPALVGLGAVAVGAMIALKYVKKIVRAA